MIRKALDLDRKKRQASPDYDPDEDQDNGAYLDSLGWVLFKRGQAKEAKKVLLEAVKDKGRQHIEIFDHLADRFRPGTEDRGRIVLRPRATPLCLVQIDETLTTSTYEAWRHESSQDINPVPAAGEALRYAREKGYAIVYLALAADRPTLYQKMRGWVAYHSTAGAEPFPAGVVVSRFTLPEPNEERRPWQKTAELLSKRFPLPKDGKPHAHVAIAGTMDAARQLHAAGLRTLYLGAGEDLPQGMPRVPGWDGVRRALED